MTTVTYRTIREGASADRRFYANRPEGGGIWNPVDYLKSRAR